MKIQGEKTLKTACKLYKLTSVSVNVTLEISCTVCKTFLWNSCTVSKTPLWNSCKACKTSLWNSCTACKSSLWKCRVKRHLQLPVHCIT